jgi:predicted RNA-binding Zn-ribbon protein involved in translation (DUF1610 family)
MVFILGAAILGAILFYFSYQSRQSFSCPTCGEKIITEYLDAKNCTMCGADLKKDH